MSAAVPVRTYGRIDRAALRLSMLLVGWACRRLPQPDREDRLQEWTCELYAIFDDPDLSRALQRASRALLYALDHHRGVHHLCARPARSSQVHRMIPARLRTVALFVLDNYIVVGLVVVGLVVGRVLGVVIFGSGGVVIFGSGVVVRGVVVRYLSRRCYFRAEESSRRHKKELS